MRLQGLYARKGRKYFKPRRDTHDFFRDASGSARVHPYPPVSVSLPQPAQTSRIALETPTKDLLAYLFAPPDPRFVHSRRIDVVVLMLFFQRKSEQPWFQVFQWEGATCGLGIVRGLRRVGRSSSPAASRELSHRVRVFPTLTFIRLFSNLS